MAEDGTKTGGAARVPAAFLVALVAGRTVADAADAAGVSERTAYRWLTNPEVKAEVRKLRAGLTAQAIDTLVGLLSDAANVMGGLLRSESEGIRLAAARSLLSVGLAYKEAFDLDERLADLERRQGLREAAAADEDLDEEE